MIVHFYDGFVFHTMLRSLAFLQAENKSAIIIPFSLALLGRTLNDLSKGALFTIVFAIP